MGFGDIVCERLTTILGSSPQFMCGLALIMVFNRCVSMLMHKYRNLSLNIDETPKYDKRTLELHVHWHTELISGLVLTTIAVAGLEIMLGSFVENLVQSLSVGIGFGLKELMSDVVYGFLSMAQGHCSGRKVVVKDKEYDITCVHLTHVTLHSGNTTLVRRWTNYHDDLIIRDTKGHGE